MSAPATNLDGAVDGVKALRNSYSSFLGLHVNSKVGEKQWQAAAAAAGGGPMPGNGSMQLEEDNCCRHAKGAVSCPDTYVRTERSAQEVLNEENSPTIRERLLVARAAGSGAAGARSMRASRSGLPSPPSENPASESGGAITHSVSSTGVGEESGRSRTAARHASQTSLPLDYHELPGLSSQPTASAMASSQDLQYAGMQSTPGLASAASSDAQLSMDRNSAPSHGLRRQYMMSTPGTNGSPMTGASVSSGGISTASSSRTPGASTGWGSSFHSLTLGPDKDPLAVTEQEEEDDVVNEYDLENFNQRRTSRFRNSRMRSMSASNSSSATALSAALEETVGLARSELSSESSSTSIAGTQQQQPSLDRPSRKNRAPIPRGTLTPGFCSIDLVEACMRRPAPEPEPVPEPAKGFNVLDILPGPGMLDTIEHSHLGEGERSSAPTVRPSPPSIRPGSGRARNISASGTNLVSSYVRGGAPSPTDNVPRSYGPSAPVKPPQLFVSDPTLSSILSRSSSIGASSSSAIQRSPSGRNARPSRATDMDSILGMPSQMGGLAEEDQPSVSGLRSTVNEHSPTSSEPEAPKVLLPNQTGKEYGPLASRDSYIGAGGRVKVREKALWQGNDGQWRLQ